MSKWISELLELKNCEFTAPDILFPYIGYWDYRYLGFLTSPYGTPSPRHLLLFSSLYLRACVLARNRWPFYKTEHFHIFHLIWKFQQLIGESTPYQKNLISKNTCYVWSAVVWLKVRSREMDLITESFYYMDQWNLWYRSLLNCGSYLRK